MRRPFRPSSRHLIAPLVSGGAVGLVTGGIYAARPFVPVLSLGVLYLFAVLPTAVLWGVGYAVLVAVASMLTFNFLFLPPVHTFGLGDSANWFALAVFVVTAVVVSELAARSRRRAKQALEAEQLRRSDAFKTTVLRAVSHDLRSPLTAIRTAVEAVESPVLELSGADRAELLATIRLETRRLERLVGNLLDLSRLEAGAATPRRELWAVDELVSRSLDEIGIGSERVRVTLADDLALVVADGTHVERVLVNLLENALKFSSPGDVVDLVCTCESGGVVIRVLDRGPGVRAEEQARIFDAFDRARATGATRGSGLGLAIARGFAEANGGRVWVEDVEHGAGFAVALETATAPVGVST